MQQKQPDEVRKDLLLQKLFRAKLEMGKLIKSSANPFFKSSYADLNAHLAVAEPALEKHGLILTQPTGGNQLGNFVVSRISDTETGEFLESSLKLPELDDMQKLGSAITYARRYTLGSLLSMVAEDDDGNKATGKIAKKASKKAATSDF